MHTENALLQSNYWNPHELTVKVLSYVEETMQWDSLFESSIMAASADLKVVSLRFDAVVC